MSRTRPPRNPPLVDDLAFLPPQEMTPVAGFHAYSHRLGAASAEDVDVRVSGEGVVDIRVVRYGASTADVTVVDELPRAEARPREIARGNYLYVERVLERWAPLTVEAWVRTLADAPASGLITQGGFGLALVEGNRARLTVPGSRGVLEVIGPPMSLCTWHHLVGVCDRRRIVLYVDGVPVGEARGETVGVADDRPLLIGASADAEAKASAFFTGDLCGPTVYGRVLAPRVIARRFRERATTPARGGGVLGAWKFDAVGGKRPYRDASRFKRPARPVNYPLRMIPGPKRTADSDWSTYDPTADPDFGFAVRLMSDAVVDCRWPVTATWRVPPDLRSGQYAARVTNGVGEVRDVPFIVRPPQRGRSRRSRHGLAPLACLSTTNTRVAYNFDPFADERLDYGAYRQHPRYPLLGHLLGLRRPASGEPWFRQTLDFELSFYGWLDRQGIPYDLYTEWDLEAEPDLLAPYRAVAWAGHSEYWSATQFERLLAFARAGGHVLALSGNTAYWRVSVDFSNQVIEVRKHDRFVVPGTNNDPMIHAAHWHQMDDLPGVTLRQAGWPEWALTGMATHGSTNPPLDGPRAGFQVLSPDHWAFHEPREVDTLGELAPRAAGYETDLTCRSMLTLHGGPHGPHYPPRDDSPDPKLSDPFDEGLTVLARAKIPGSNLLAYDNEFTQGEMWSEIAVWEGRRESGWGLTFAVGSVLSGEVLLTEDNFSKLVLNVMDRMGVGPPRE